VVILIFFVFLFRLIEQLTLIISENGSTHIRLYNDALFYILGYLSEDQENCFHEFESKLNDKFSLCTSMLFPLLERVVIIFFLVLCCYDMRLFSAPFMQRVFATHPVISVGAMYYTTNMYYITDNVLDFFGRQCVKPFNEASEPSSLVERWIAHLHGLGYSFGSH